MAATDLMYHFPPLFATISTMSMKPKLQLVPLDRPLYWELLLQGETLSRVAHHLLASVAVAATFGMLLRAPRAATAPGEPDANRPAAPEPSAHRMWLARIALVATLLQLPVGVWVLMAMPLAMQQQLMGQDWLATLLFGASVVSALGLMHHLAIVSLGDTGRGPIARTALLMFLTVLMMSAAFHRARRQTFQQVRDERPAAVIYPLSPSLDS